MSALIKWVESQLVGRKTYVGSACLALAVFALQAGYIDDATFGKIQAVLIAWLGASLRSAITKTAGDAK